MQYRTGTVTVTNGSAVVTGSGTSWLTYVSAGSLFKKQSTNVIYDIASVDSNTQITLSSVYAGISESGISYAIVKDFTPNLGLPEIWAGDIDWPTVLTKALRLLDTAFEGTVLEPTVVLTAAENLVLGNIVYMNSAGKVGKANATSVATVPAIGIVVSTTIAQDATGNIMKSGSVHLHDLAPGWTKGLPIYLNNVAGGTTQDVSGFTTGMQVQVLGIATDTDVILFNPSYVLVEVA